MRYIGDVHGKFDDYELLISEVPESIQIGDLGVGFVNHPNPSQEKMVEHNARFIRGNHDNPRSCRGHSQWIADGMVEGKTMFVGGATSIDKAWRVEGVSWWADEELSQAEFGDIMDTYIDVKPRVMVTHECPEEVAMALMGRTKLDFPSITRQAFQHMWSAHSPELWVFGHWHQSFDKTYRGTRFICLDELEVLDL